MRDAMDHLLPRLAKVVSNLCKLAREWKATPTLAYTHLQPGILFTHHQQICRTSADHSLASSTDYGYAESMAPFQM